MHCSSCREGLLIKEGGAWRVNLEVSVLYLIMSANNRLMCNRVSTRSSLTDMLKSSHKRLEVEDRIVSNNQFVVLLKMIIVFF